MKILLTNLVFVIYLLVFPVAAMSEETSVDATTIFQFEQRAITGAPKKNLAPATQFLGLDVGKLADGNLSIHLYGWGRADLEDKSYNNDRYDGSLTYGFLQYRFKEANADIRAGRLFVREGIVNEQIDGLSAHTDLPRGFGISAFGGANVHTTHLYGENSDGKGDGIAGGRVNYRYKGMLDLGASGVYESTAPKLVSQTNGNHRLLGSDVWFSPYRMVDIIGHSSYNSTTKTISEHSYLLNIKPVNDLVLSGEFNEQHDRAYFYAWSMMSRSALNPADRSRSVGGSTSYQISKELGLVADYKHYTREIGNADRFGGTVKLSILNNELLSSIGYHYLRAGSGFAITGSNSTPSASYHELRGYIMHDPKTYFASVDALGYLFKEKVLNEKAAWEVTGSLGYHITSALAVSGNISYGRNPEFTEETKGLIRLTYAMAFDPKGGKK